MCFHCWILAGFSTYDKSLIYLFMNWIKKNAVRMLWVRRMMKASHEKKATRRKLWGFCVLFCFLNQAQTRKVVRDVNSIEDRR